MDTFSQEEMRSYSDEFRSLPNEYYDSGCRDWHEEFYHQPKIPENWPYHRAQPNGYSEKAKLFLIRDRSFRRYDLTPHYERDRRYYAMRYANIFARAARLAERDTESMPDKEYYRLLGFQRRYEAQSEKFEH